MAIHEDYQAVLTVNEQGQYVAPGGGTGGGSSNPNGQATSANSSPVVIASDQSSVPINDAGGNISVDDGGGSLTVDFASQPLPTGAATDASVQAVTTAQNTGNTSLATLATAATPASATGSLAALNSYVAITNSGRDNMIIQITGTWVGTVSIQGSLDGANWTTFGGAALILNLGTNAYQTTITANGMYQVGVSGVTYIRLTETAFTSGSATVTVTTVDGNAMLALDTPLPTGSNTIGAITGTVTANATFVAPSATGATITPFLNGAVTNTAVTVKAAAGRLLRYRIYNPNTAPGYLQVFNSLIAGVTLGTTVPIEGYVIPAGGTLDGAVDFSFPYTTGISIAATIPTTVANGTAATALTTGLVVSLGYV